MILDGCAGSAHIDSSGEVLDVQGADISDYLAGKAYVNFEHRSGGESTPLDIVGRVIYAKKIFNAKDCEDDRQLMYWGKVGEVPYIYVKVRLADEAGHPGAIALAALIRDELANEGKVNISYSVEGTTLERDGNKLKKTVLKALAITVRPCNKSTEAGVLHDGGIVKEQPKKDLLAGIGKFEDPIYAKLARGEEVEYTAVDFEQLDKAMTAGSYNATPSTLTGGAALQVEDPSLKRGWVKSQIEAAYRDWDKKGDFKKFLKNKLPDINDEYLERFSDLVDDYRIKLKKAVEEVVVAKIERLQKDVPMSKEKVVGRLHRADALELERLMDTDGWKSLTSDDITELLTTKPNKAGISDYAIGYLAEHPNFNKEHILLATKHPNANASLRPFAFGQLAKHPEFNTEHLAQALKHHNIDGEKILELSQHPAWRHLTKEQIGDAVKSIARNKKGIGVLDRHPNFGMDNFVDAIKGGAYFSAQKNPFWNQLSEKNINDIVSARPSMLSELLDHPNFTKSAMTAALSNSEVNNRNLGVTIVNHPSFDESHIPLLLKDRNTSLNTIQHIMGKYELSKESIKALLQHPNVNWYTASKLDTSNFTPEDFSELLKNPDIDPSVLANLATHPAVKGPILQELIDHPKARQAHEHILNRGDLTDENIKSIALHDDLGYHAQEAIKRHPQWQGLTSEDVSDIITEKGGSGSDISSEFLKFISSHPNFTKEHLQEAMRGNLSLGSDGLSTIIKHPLSDRDIVLSSLSHRRANRYTLADAMQHPQWDDSMLEHAMNSGSEDVARAAESHMEYIDPDSTHDLINDYDGKVGQIHISHGSEPLRALRAKIEEKGGEVHPNELGVSPITAPVKAKSGKITNQRTWQPFLNDKGLVDANKIGEHIDSLPKNRFNYSHSVWDASNAQNSTGEDQHVFQLNLSSEHVKQMKEAGVWNTFRNMHQASMNSGHPVRRSTVGWVRYSPHTDKHGQSHHYVEEIQTDFGQSFVKRAAEEARQNGVDVDEAVSRAQSKFSDDHLQKIQKILFGGQHPNTVIHEGFRQHLREQGKHNDSIHLIGLEGRATLSGWELPGPEYARITYNKIPKEFGMEPAKYGEHPAQQDSANTEPGLSNESTWKGKVNKTEEDLRAAVLEHLGMKPKSPVASSPLKRDWLHPELPQQIEDQDTQHLSLLQTVLHDGEHFSGNSIHPTHENIYFILHNNRPIAKFMIFNHKFHMLEDHEQLLGDVENQTPGDIARHIHAIKQDPEYKIVHGNHQDAPTNETLSQFEYSVGNQEPQVIEFNGKKATIDGFDISAEELRHIMQNVRDGKARLHSVGETPQLTEETEVNKIESMFTDLFKIEPALRSALAGMDSAIKAGILEPEHAKTLRRQIFADTMVPGMGNKKAYFDFLTRPRKGVHIHLDSNDHGSLNKRFGYDVGDEAIKAYGKHIQEAIKATVGKGKAKSYHISGDEFVLHVPTHEDAFHVMRELRNRLDSTPPINGVHKLSISAGLGETRDVAESALMAAKNSKKNAQYPLGQAKTHIHSMLPGSEGAIDPE